MKKPIIKLLSRIFPNTVAKIAYKKFTNPQTRKLREHEVIMLDKAKKLKTKIGNFEIQTYEWGNVEDERILLIHGWEGQAGNFTDIIQELLKNKYYVISFDGPSHGFSSKGNASLFSFGDLVGIMIKKYKCKKLVSHSFGGVATTHALFKNPELKVDKYVLLTTPDKLSQRVDDVAKFLGVTKNVKDILIKKLETEISLDLNQASVSNFVRKINVAESMIIHDRNDIVIPIAQSRNVHQSWKVSHFREIEGTGHFRILRTKEVIDMIIEFMN